MNTKRRRRKTEINIVPLIDVLTVLIFFFLMAMQFRHVDVLNITPPEMETAGKAEGPDQLIVGIRDNGDVFVNNRQMSMEEMESLFEEVSHQDPKPSVLLLADENTPLRHVTLVMDLARKNKLERMRLQTR